MRDANRWPLRRRSFPSATLVGVAGFALLAHVACGDDASAPGSDGDAGADGSIPRADGGPEDAAASDAGADGATGPDATPAGDASIDASDGGPDATPIATAPQPLLAGAAFYPRAIALSDGTILASVVAPQASGHLGATILASADDAMSFSIVGHVDDAARSQGGLCCGTLYELPRALGALPAGTVLWSASVGGDQSAAPMSLPIWSSADRGKTWAYLSTAYVAPVPHSGPKGIWEPEFSMLDDGSLVCHFSDETDAAHSQKLGAVRTSDGVAWGQRQDTVALTASGARPGMAIVRRPTGGPFVMSYEVCGEPSDNCAAHLRTSNDGWSWGDPTDIGLRPATVDGKHFLHAPTIAWTSTPGSFGRFFLVGQVAVDGTGAVLPENGNLLLANAQQGGQFWYALPAPLPVDAPYDNFCPNYSSPLLPLDGGRLALELAAHYDGTTCRTYFARGGLTGTGDATGVDDGKKYRFVSTMSALCLDVSSGSPDAGANVQQWTCNDLPPQNWSATRAADGTFALRAENSGMCLARAGGGAAAGTNVDQEPCDGSTAQSWGVRNVGTGYVILHVPGAATCLDVAGGSTTPGGNVALWTCNDLAPQIWHAEPR